MTARYVVVVHPWGDGAAAGETVSVFGFWRTRKRAEAAADDIEADPATNVTAEVVPLSEVDRIKRTKETL